MNETTKTFSQGKVCGWDPHVGANKKEQCQPLNRSGQQCQFVIKKNRDDVL
jgi:hypothetical protein